MLIHVHVMFVFAIFEPLTRRSQKPKAKNYYYAFLSPKTLGNTAITPGSHLWEASTTEILFSQRKVLICAIMPGNIVVNLDVSEFVLSLGSYPGVLGDFFCTGLTTGILSSSWLDEVVGGPPHFPHG